MTSGLQLEHPWLLAGLVLLPLWWLLRAWLLRREAVPYAPLQHRAASGRSSLRSRLGRLRLPLEVLLLAVLLLGLAGPYRETRLELVEDEGVDVMLVLDISLSMLAEDFPPNRLEALRRLARDFIARSGSNRTGLVVFAKDAFVQTPLTTDHPALLSLLDGVTVYAVDQGRSGGTAIGDALALAADRLRAVKVEGRDQAVVLITDGESNQGMEPELAARWLRHLGLGFYAVGIGGPEPVEVVFEGRQVGGDTPYRAFLDDRELRRVAELAGGLYYRALDVDALEEIFLELSSLESAPLEHREVALRRSWQRSFALAAFGLFAVNLGLGGFALRRPLR